MISIHARAGAALNDRNLVHNLKGTLKRPARRKYLYGLGGTLCAVLVMVSAGPAAAVPVQYVRICDAYGAQYYYIPGTDKCGDASGAPYKVQTAYGTITNTP